MVKGLGSTLGTMLNPWPVIEHGTCARTTGAARTAPNAPRTAEGLTAVDAKRATVTLRTG